MYDEIVTVTGNRPLSGSHFLLSVESPRQAQATRPGQFAMLRILGRSDALLRRPMSIYDVRGEIREGVSKGVRPTRGGQNPLCRHPRIGGGSGLDSRSPAFAEDKFRGNDERGVIFTREGDRKRASLRVLQFLYKVVGHGTRLMSELEPGDQVGLLAPLGHGFFEEEYLPRAHEANEILHVAGGIGIAALLLPAKRLAEAGFRQRLFFGVRSKADLVRVEDFRPLLRGILLATEDGSVGYRGFVTRPLEEYLARHTHKKYLLMVCGPWAMLRATVELATKYGHPCLVSMENRMGCGLGVCLGCCIRVQGSGHEAYQRVCTEGPVFWADKIVWEAADGK
jgi:dihydroorotate dehydrogenase electron transfer subunit